MNQEAPSRIQEARRRIAGAKRIAVAATAAGFLAVLLLARESHPGQASASSGSSGSSRSSSDSTRTEGFDFDSGSVAPSTGSSTSQTQTGVS